MVGGGGGGGGVHKQHCPYESYWHFLMNQFSFEQSESRLNNCFSLIKIVLCDILKGN